MPRGGAITKMAMLLWHSVHAISGASGNTGVQMWCHNKGGQFLHVAMCKDSAKPCMV